MSRFADLSPGHVSPPGSNGGDGAAPRGAGVLRQLDSPLRFLGAFMREPLTVGALWPSSKALARAVVDGCEFKPSATVVELGPGTGAFTKLLLDRLDARGRFIGVELN